MKLFSMAAVGLIALTGIAPGIAAPAAAQRTVVTERTVVRHDTVRHDNVRHDDDRRYRRPHVRTRTVCTREWRNGHRTRVCHQVRYRR